MDPIRIDIPDAKPKTLRQQAGQIVVDALAEAGLCSRKSLRSAAVVSMAEAWGRGDCTRGDFVTGCRKVAILNPSLKA